MSYALTTLVRAGRNRKPRGFDESALTFVVLDPGDRAQAESGTVIAYYEEGVSAHPSILTIATVADEVLTPTNRTRLSDALGGRPINGRAWNQHVADFLNPRPSIQGERVIWLGPGGAGQNRFWQEWVAPESHSRVFKDHFNRADATLNGSTLSDGSTTWTSTLWAIVSNVAQLTGMTTETLYTALTTAEGDTDSAFAIATLRAYARGAAGTFLNAALSVCTSASAISGYQLALNEDTLNGSLVLYAVSIETDLATSTTDPSVGATYRITRNGSSVEGFVNGTSTLGPVTDTSEATGVGNRHVGFTTYWEGVSGTRTVEFDDFIGGDLNAPWSKLPISGVG